MNIQQAMRRMLQTPTTIKTSKRTHPPKSPYLREIETKAEQISKLSDNSLLEAEKLTTYLKKLKRKYDTVISEKGLSIIEYAKSNIISKITTFTPTEKKLVINFDKLGNKIFKKYNLNNDLIKILTKKSPQNASTQTSQIIEKQYTTNIKNKTITRTKVYYHRNSKQIETILNYDDNGNIISNQVYNQSGEMVSQTIFSDSIPLFKTIYKNSQKRLTFEYNILGSFKSAQEYDKNGKVISTIEQVTTNSQINSPNTTYIQKKFVDNGNIIKIEYDRKGYKIKHTEYDSTGKELESKDYIYSKTNTLPTSKNNILEFLKNP